MTDDPLTSPDPELSDYLLGELDADARARFERRIAAEPALRAQVERLAPAVARLEQVPEQAWETLPPAVALPPRPQGAGASGGRHVHGRLRLPALTPRAWAAAGLAAAALLGTGVAIGTVVGGDGPSAATAPQSAAIALDPFGGAPASASANARMVGPDRMLLTITELPPAPAGSYYEAWLLDGPGEVVPVASFAVGDDGRAVVELPLPAAAGSYRYLDVSLQRIDGGPRHSGDSVLRGALS